GYRRVAVASYGAGQEAASRLLLPAPSSALLDLGALVLGDDALNVFEELAFGRGGTRSSHVLDGDAGALDLFDQQQLICEPPGQAVGVMDQDDVAGLGAHRLAEAV